MGDGNADILAMHLTDEDLAASCGGAGLIQSLDARLLPSQWSLVTTELSRVVKVAVDLCMTGVKKGKLAKSNCVRWENFNVERWVLRRFVD